MVCGLVGYLAVGVCVVCCVVIVGFPLEEVFEKNNSVSGRRDYIRKFIKFILAENPYLKLNHIGI